MGLADYITTGYDAAPVATRTPIVVQTQQSESDLYLPLLKARLALNASVSDYDAALKTLLAEAISEIEQYTGLSLQPSTVVASYAPYTGETLPYGPVWTDPLPTLTATREGSTITVSSQTNGQVDAGPFPTLLVPFAYGTVAYKAGYSMADGATYAVPAGLIGAVLSYAADSWRSGGVTGGVMPTTWKRIAGPYRRFD